MRWREFRKALHILCRLRLLQSCSRLRLAVALLRGRRSRRRRAAVVLGVVPAPVDVRTEAQRLAGDAQSIRIGLLVGLVVDEEPVGVLQHEAVAAGAAYRLAPPAGLRVLQVEVDVGEDADLAVGEVDPLLARHLREPAFSARAEELRELLDPPHAVDLRECLAPG